MEAQGWLWWIPFLPLIGSVVCGVLHFRTLAERKRGVESKGKMRLAGLVGCGALAASLVLAILAFFQVRGAESAGQRIVSSTWEWIHVGDLAFDITLVLDPLSSALSLVVTGVGLLIHIYSTGYMSEDRGYAKFFAYLNLFVFAMLVLILSSSLLGLFIGWEGVGLCSYLLIGFWYDKGWPAEAAQKAFVVNRIGDACFLIGSFVLVNLCGTLDMAQIGTSVGELIHDPDARFQIGLAALLLFGGCCGKSAQIPLFTWLPDAMAGPTPVSALIHAATMVTAGIYLVVRLNPMFAAAPAVLTIMALGGALTALIGASTALVQRDIKKVLAYSTVSQLGYMFLGLGSGAFAAAIFHLITHAFFKGLLFLGAGSVIHGMHEEQDMHKMGGLRRYMPRTYATFLAGAAALSGLPLMSGFFSKDEILALTFANGLAGNVLYFGLWMVGIASAAMTAYYTWRMVALTFFGKERFNPHQVHPHESPASMTTPLMVLAVASVFGGVLGLPVVLHVPHLIHDWLHPVIAPGEAIIAERMHGHVPHLSHALEWVLLIFGAGLALFFAHRGFHAYKEGTEADEAFAERRPEVANFLQGAWGIDAAYSTNVVQPTKLFAFVTAVVVDQFAIDGVVNGTATLANSAGQRLRRLTDGRIVTYALWIGAGAVAIALFWM